MKYTGGAQYFYFKIIQTNDDDAENRVWTAPVWFEPNVANPGPLPPSLRLVVDRVAEVAAITNTGGQAISLTGWTLRSVRGDQRFTFPSGQPSTIQAGKALVVRSGPSAVGNQAGTLNWTTNFIWNNENDPAELMDANMNLVVDEP